MSPENILRNSISEDEFISMALQVFHYQFENNTVYRSFCDIIGTHSSDINTLEDIPYLPIELFKLRRITTGEFKEEAIFLSSGTTGKRTSKHVIKDLQLYNASAQRAFEYFYGPLSDYAILALLPSYLERSDASLVYMVQRWMHLSRHPKNGFFLNEFQQLQQRLDELEASGQKVLLIGVSFALLDFIDQYKNRLGNTIIMETGGMKGRRQELIRIELHTLLAEGFGVKSIHSEYGMTELLSQAYSKGNGLFKCPPWMQISIRDLDNPFRQAGVGQTGGINIIDLANIYSCSFVATQDLGRETDLGFEVLGRMDHAEMRGCSLMI